MAWIVGIARGFVFAVGACGVVAFAADLPAHAVPHLLQVAQLRAEHRLRVAPHRDLALAR